MPNRRYAVFLLALLTSAVMVGYYFYTKSVGHTPLALSSPPKGGGFTATSNQGPVSLSDFKGKWVYLYFGYTFCPDICPTNLGNMSAAYHQLTPEEKRQVQFLFFSVDPNRDTPKRLAEYSRYYDMNLIGITSDKANIDHVTQQYGAVYTIHGEAKDPDNYSVDHSAFTYVISPQGKLMTQLPHGTNGKAFLQNIRHNLKTQ